MKKRVLSILLAVLLLVSLLPTAAFAAEHTDTKGHWGESAIERWSDYGVVAGKGNGVFDPDGLMKRGEAAQVFANLFRLTAKGDLSDYTDVGSGKWYDDAIAKCVKAGILSGKGAGTMDPEGTITREEFFAMFARALGIEPETAAEVAVADGAQAASWAAGYITALVNRGYVKGTGSADGGVTVQPKLNINRASVMSLMDQTIGTYVNTTEKVTAGDGLTLIVVDNANVTFAKGTESAEVYVFGNNAAITNAPVGTVVTTSEDATGTKVNGKTVSKDTTTTVEQAKPSSGGGGSYTPPTPTTPTTFKAVAVKDGTVIINEAEVDAYNLTFYYDALDHSSEGIVYDPVYTAPAEENPENKALRAAWGYNEVREQIKSVKIDNSVKDYHGLTSMAYMLYDMSNAESISGTENLDVSNVTSMKSMFNGYGGYVKNFNSIPNLSGWNTAKVTDMSGMFGLYGWSSTSLNTVPDVSGFATSNVTDMNDMFASYGYSSTVLNVVPNVSGFDTAKVTDMDGMFYEYGYSSIALNAVPDVSKFITDQVTDIHDMFGGYGCASTALSSVPNVSNWNTKNVTDMYSMFNSYGYSSETLNFTLDLSEWSVGSIDSSNSEKYVGMFGSAGASTATWSVTIPAKTGGQANDATHWYVGDGTDTNKYISPASDKAFTPDTRTFKAVYNTNGGANTLTFYYDNVDHSGENITVYEDGTGNYLFNDSKHSEEIWGYASICASVTNVVIDESVKNYKGLTSTAYMFHNMIIADNIDGAEYLDVSNVTDMNNMFKNYGAYSGALNCVPDVSGWNTANVKNMSNVFDGYGSSCNALNCVPDVSGWDTASVTNMSNMFYSYGAYSGLQEFSLDLSNWSVENVTNFEEMFKLAGYEAKWSVTIPAKTGEQANDTTHWYVGNGTDTTKYIAPATSKTFTVAPGTVEQVLATVEGFPTSSEKAWVGNKPMTFCYINGDNLKIGGIKAISLPLTTTVSGSGNGFTCSNDSGTFTFNMEAGKLTSIKVNGSREGSFDDTYAPAAANVPVTSVSIEPNTLELSVGGDQTLSATVLPENATNKNVTWSSNNTGVATVSEAGKVTAVAAGTATITVTTVDGSKTATCTVTVTAPTPVTYTVTFIPIENRGKVLDSNGQNVTEITVPSGTAFSVSNNQITIGENVYNAVPNNGWVFHGFEPNSGTITGATIIRVDFDQAQH